MNRTNEGVLVRVPAAGVLLEGNLTVAPRSAGIVMFAHGSGSSRHSPRNRAVARALNDGGLATLLVDLLTPAEESEDEQTGRLRFVIDLLAERLVDAADWLSENEETSALPIGLFGASTGGGAALVAAAQRPNTIRAVVSRGGRPDLAGAALSRVKAPTLLIVGGQDYPVIEMNQEAFERLRCEKKVEIVPGATHLFSEPGALEEVARLARDWFRRFLTPPAAEFRKSREREPEARS